MNGLTACLTGHVGGDPEFRYSSNGNPYMTFSLAADDSKRAETDPTEWVRCAVFGELAEALNGKLVKGSRAYAEGRLRLEQWAGQDGVQRSALKLTAWVLTPMGLENRRPRSQGRNGPQEARSGPMAASVARRMPEHMAVTGGRNTRVALGLDDGFDPYGGAA